MVKYMYCMYMAAIGGEGVAFAEVDTLRYPTS